MGRTYYGKKTQANGLEPTFDVNISGTQILSVLTAEFSLERANYSGSNMAEQVDPPWKAKKAVAMSMGRKLEAASDDQIRAALPKVKRLWGGTPDEFVEMVREWQSFLLNCGGYYT